MGRIPLHGVDSFDFTVRRSPFLQRVKSEVFKNDLRRRFGEDYPRKAELKQSLQEDTWHYGPWDSPYTIYDTVSRSLKNSFQAFQTLKKTSPEIEEAFQAWKQYRSLYNPREVEAYGKAIDMLPEVYETMKVVAELYRNAYEERNKDHKKSRQDSKEAHEQQDVAMKLFGAASDIVTKALDAYNQERKERLNQRSNGGWHEEVYFKLKEIGLKKAKSPFTFGPPGEAKLDPGNKPFILSAGDFDIALSTDKIDLDAQGRQVNWIPYRDAMHKVLNKYVQIPAMNLLRERNRRLRRPMTGVMPLTVKYLARRERVPPSNGKWQYSISGAQIVAPGTDEEWAQQVVGMITSIPQTTLPAFPANTLKAGVLKSVTIGPSRIEALDAAPDEFYVFK